MHGGTGTGVASPVAMRQELRQRVLQRALDLAGGPTFLCAMLGVARDRLGEWLGGSAPIPDEAFENAVELVLRDAEARAAQDRRAEPRDGTATPA